MKQGDKTEGQRFVSALRRSSQLAPEEFIATRLLHHKDSPVWFYHYTQSFSPEEPITPELAHTMAREFAAQAWPENEVLIATHVDARHIHSHFLVNAVCQESGKMLRQGPRTLEHLRQLSDQLCLRHGLSVVQPKHRRTNGMSNREYRAAAKGQSWKFELMNVIDDCMRRACSRREFLERMRALGYSVKWTEERKNITYTTPTGMKCRDSRLHDDRYLKEAMERELRIREEIINKWERRDDGIQTGWEEERAALLASLACADRALAADSRGDPGSWDGLLRAVDRLGRHLEHASDDAPVRDASSKPQHSDRKILRREQQKKIALGHRPDDHEDPQWSQAMQ